ncbi:MAG: DUF4037 domain-containing protein [Clostridia bacterium]|nr:DUF4037 domain-containing protein [Clostridia bacterium]
MNNIVSIISEKLKSISIGECSIALAGSRAYGGADDDSDIDFYMLVESMKPHDEIVEIIKTIADKDSDISVSASFDFAPYGGGIDFRYCRIPVEVTVKYYSMIRKRLDDCLEGKFVIIPQTWTSNGYYTYISVSEIDFIEPLWDPNGFIAEYKQKLCVYPEKLRQSIISCFMERAYTWMNNFHYESAIRRGDFMFTSACVLHTVQDLIQVIFAVNGVYFKGDKKLEDSLKRLPYCPKKFLDNLLFLMQTSKEPQQLERQYEILKNTVDELNARC